MCHNPDGLFWAGDTAQTISAGSSFRFNDLKAFLYRVEVRPPISPSRLGGTNQLDCRKQDLDETRRYNPDLFS